MLNLPGLMFPVEESLAFGWWNKLCSIRHSWRRSEITRMHRSRQRARTKSSSLVQNESKLIADTAPPLEDLQTNQPLTINVQKQPKTYFIREGTKPLKSFPIKLFCFKSNVCVFTIIFFSLKYWYFKIFDLPSAWASSARSTGGILTIINEPSWFETTK